MHSLLLVELGLCGGINCEILVDFAKELCRVHAWLRREAARGVWVHGVVCADARIRWDGPSPCLPDGLARDSSER